MAAMTDEREFPKTLSAPVDEETWSWFKDQAKADFRTSGAHLRWLILKYKHDVEAEQRAVGLLDDFGAAVARATPTAPRLMRQDSTTGLQLPEPEPTDEGML